MTTGPMTTGLTTAGLTNCPAGGDPAVPSHLCAAAESAAAAPNVCPNADPRDDHPNADSWRLEVAARLERYRARRKPRTPRYPSLLLPFDAPENWSRSAPPSGSVAIAAAPPRAGQDFAFDIKEEATAIGSEILAPSRRTPEPQVPERHPSEGAHRYPEQAPEQSAKVIEFPRSAAIPVFHSSELADPIFDRPRIVEVPEILPAPPALGGMLIEPAQQEPAGTQADSSSASPSGSASIGRRALAALVDGVVVATALAGVAAIFLRLNPVRGPLPLLAGALGSAAALLWMTYEFLFVVYTGSTPGLRAARLRLAGFDGSPLHRRSRRWRVLATFLSAFSAGLGYLWCVLDQDGLCWHDRITRTHVQSETPAE